MGKFVLTAELKLQAPGNINSVVNEINSRLKDIQINFKLQDANKAVSGLNDVTKAADKTSVAVNKMGYAFGVSLKRFAAFSLASRAIGLFSNRLASAIDDAINFQDQMVRLSQITGETTKDLRYIADEIGGLATKFGVTSKAILSATDILAQAGLQANDLRVAINALAKTELAPTFGRIEDTAEGAVAILAQFGEGVGALERQLGSINRVAAQFAVESEDLISVVRRTGGVFKASGGSLEELLAVFTSVRATTRESAESIATGLRTIFTRIQRPQTIEYLKQFGVELTDINGKFVGPYKAVQQLSEALSQFGEGDIRFIAIAEELGGYRQIGKVIPLIRQFAVAEQARQVAVEGGTSLNEDAAKSQESLRRQFIRTQESFLKLIRDIGDTTSFQTMVKVGLNLANAFIKIADSIKPIIPLIGALAAIKFAQGIGNFASGIGAGFRQIVGPRAKNAGGKIHAFARGGLVPGSGNRDTVPAMLSPGEFVIRKSSVNKIGAGRLAAMNENRYTEGGNVSAVREEIARQRASKIYSGEGAFKFIDKIDDEIEKYGGAFLSPEGASKNLSGTVEAGAIEKKLKTTKEYQILNRVKDPGIKTEFKTIVSSLAKKSKFVIQASALQKDVSEKVEDSILSGVISSVKMGANELGTTIGSSKFDTGTQAIADILRSTNIDNVIGNIYEAILINAGSPYSLGKDSANDPFDFPYGLKSVATNFDARLKDIPTDAKTRFTADNLSTFVNKVKNYQSEIARKDFVILLKSMQGQFNKDVLGSGNMSYDDINKFVSNLKVPKGKEIQKFAKGTSGKGVPLVDDILQNAPGSAILPTPSKAIQSIIDAGGAAIDVDRTLIRTIGDTAYAKAKTAKAQQEVLTKYFRDPVARMRDITTSPLTQFGQELIRAVASGAVDPKTLSIISKSSAVPGLKQYISKKFGIPMGNMQFTSGANKVPFLQKASTAGPQIAKTKKFATGGPAPSDTVPALLTPGEFVINKQSAQRIGYGNLNRMNKQGVAGFAKGGSVGVQKFASGSSGKGVSPTNAILKSEVDQFKQIFNKLANEGMTFAQAFQIAEQEMQKVGKTSKAFNKYLNSQKERIIQLPENAKRESSTQQQKAEKTSKAPAQASTQQQKAEKDANASFVKFAAFTGALNTVGTSLIEMGKNADGTSTTFSRIAETGLGLINQVSAVVFALQQFGVALNVKSLKQFFGSGPNSLGDKLFGGTRKSLSKTANAPERLQNVQQKLQTKISQTTDPSKKAILQQRLAKLPSVATGRGAVIGRGIASSASSLLGAAQAVAGPLAAVAASAYLVNKAFNGTISAIYNYKEQIETAVKVGDREKAGQLAEKQYGVDAGNSLRTAGIAGGAVIGAAIGAIGGPVGIAIGGAIGAIAGGILATIAANLSPQLAEFVNVLFGGDTMATAKAKVQLDASLNYYTEQQATNLKAVDAATQAWQSGLITTGQALETMGANAHNAAIAMQDAVTIINELEKGKVGGETDYVGQALDVASYFSVPGLIGKGLGYSGRDMYSAVTLGYVESDEKRNESIRKQQIEQQNKAVPGLISEFNALTNASNPLIKSIVNTSGTYDEVMAKIKSSSNGAARALAAFDDQIVLAEKLGNKSLADRLKGEKAAAKNSIEAALRASENQKKYLETLNLGLFNVVSGAQAAASALELIAMQGEGIDPLTKSMKVLEAATTSQAAAMDPKQIESSIQEYANALRKSGLQEPQVQKNIAALQATSQAQAGLGTSLEAARGRLQQSAAGGNPEEIKKVLIEAATANVTDEKQRQTIRARLGNINLDDQNIISQLATGDVSGILKAASEQLAQPTKEQIDAGNLLAKNNQALASIIMKRIEVEKQAVDAANEAIDTQLEMAKIREQFGGPKVTAAQQRLASAQRGANILMGTGIDIGGGATQDFARAGSQVQQELLALERKKATGAFNAEDKQRETQLLQAQSGLTSEAKRRLELAKEESDIVKKKVSLEKSALEKMLGGDVIGAIEDMMASSAAKILETGDVGLARAFGGKALLGGLKNLEEAGASAQTKEIAARTAASTLGLSPRMAQSFAGTTPEEKAANQQVAAASFNVEQLAQDQAALARERANTAKAVEEQTKKIVNPTPSTTQTGVNQILASMPNYTPPAPEKTPSTISIPKTKGEQLVEGVKSGVKDFLGIPTAAARQGGGNVGGGVAAPVGVGISPEAIASFGASVNNFVSAVDKLQNVQLQLKFDTTNINVNLNGLSMLNGFSESAQKEIMNLAAKEIGNWRPNSNGDGLTKKGSSTIA